MNEHEAHPDPARAAAYSRQSPLSKPLAEEIVAARGLLAARKNADAASLLAASAHKDPTGEVSALLGDALFALERYAEAATAYEEAAGKGFVEEGFLAEKLEAARTNALIGPELRFEMGSSPLWLEQRPRQSQGIGLQGEPKEEPSLPGRLRRLLLNRAGTRLGALFRRDVREDAEEVWTNWYHKPKALALLKLARMRAALNKKNIFDTYPSDRRPRNLSDGRPIEKPENAETVRTIDGTWNDLDDPTMGAAGVRFGRNTPPTTRPDLETLLSPNPREISLRLMTRHEFQPVPFLNLVAASWLQFMTHDWFSHGPVFLSNDASSSLIEVPLEVDDPLRRKHHTTTMFVPATLPDPSRGDETAPPTHLNEGTHWWDASQIYASDEVTARKFRSFSGGNLELDKDDRLPLDKSGVEETGFKRNWWVGLSMVHELFVKEHNAICDMLKESHSTWSDQRLYDTARMINAALMAKIQTVEWTPAVLPNPVLRCAMHANWSGLLGSRLGFAGADLKKALPGWLTRRYPALFGIRGGARNLHGVPYAITEEFVSVYRMHPLLPESLVIRPLGAEEPVEEVPLANTRNRGARQLVERLGMQTLWNTFGTSHPGALMLNNYPRFLQNLSLPGLPVFDLAAVDILRDRERGVPRYNEFRRALQLKPIRRFEDLTNDGEAVAKLKELYADDGVEALDLLVGCLAEGHRPDHFSFGETAFQVFVLNTSRRLQADRFYTSEYRPEIYTEEGLRHIEETTLKDILLRHFPDLQPALCGVDNAFAPWQRAEYCRGLA